MEHYVPFKKLSKKAQKELNDKKRTQWVMNPVTRKEPKNAHKEKKYKEMSKYE